MARNTRKLTERLLRTLVPARWPALRPAGRATGYRHFFTHRFEQDPFPVYQHLVIRHDRRRELLEGYWVLSARMVYVFRESVPPLESHTKSHEIPLPTVAELSAALETSSLGPVLGHFFDALEQLRPGPDSKFCQNLASHQELHLELWRATRGEPCQSAEWLPVVQEIAGQPGFTMSEPSALRMGAFLQSFQSPEVETVEAGEFTLNNSKARNKLAQFQLVNPRNFVVHLIAAAVAGQSEQVEVYVDSDDIVVTFGGIPLEKTRLEHLFAELLAGRAQPRLRELAVALNAASSLRPKFLTLKCWHQGSGHTLEVLPEEERIVELQECPFDPPRDGHQVHFRDTPSLRVVRRFASSLVSAHPEHETVLLRCGLAPVPIIIEGEDRRSLPLGALAYLHWHHPDHQLPSIELTGLPGIREDSPVEGSVLLLFGPAEQEAFLLNGVTYQPPQSLNLQGFWGAVADDQATRDLSLSGLVADDRWYLLWSGVQQARERLTDFVVDNFQKLEGSEAAAWAEVLQSLARAGNTKALAAPIFKQVGGPYVTRATVLNQAKILYSDRDWEHGLRHGQSAFVLSPAAQADFSQRPTESAESLLKKSQTYHQRLREWLALEPSGFPSEVSRGSPTVSFRALDGRLELAPQEDDRLELHLYRGGRFLHGQVLSDFPAGFRALVDHGDFEMNDDWTAVWENKAFADCLAALREALPQLVRELLHSDQDWNLTVLQYLRWLQKQGQSWKQWAPQVTLRPRLAEAFPLSRYLSETRPTWRQGLKRLTEQGSLPARQVFFIRELLEADRG